MSTTSAAAVAALSQRIDDALDPLVARDRPFVLLDFPDHDNIGDSAIYAGEHRYFARRGLKPGLVTPGDTGAWDEIDRLTTGGDIYLHGGGNFGDLWPWFHDFREEVLRRFPDRRIVQLPQTLHFQSPARLEETARLIAAHGDFILLVRDQRSLQLAQRSFACDVRLCPDMAFQIGPVARPAPPRHALLLHLRADQEASAAHDASAYEGRAGVIRADWPREPEGWAEQVDRAGRLGRLPARLLQGRTAARNLRYAARAEARLRRGFELLGSARYVITDRLHGHIMSVLLGLPHCVLDNSYGKTSSFMEAWTADAPGVYTARTVDEAVEVLRGAGLELPAA